MGKKGRGRGKKGRESEERIREGKKEGKKGRGEREGRRGKGDVEWQEQEGVGTRKKNVNKIGYPKSPFPNSVYAPELQNSPLSAL